MIHDATGGTIRPRAGVSMPNVKLPTGADIYFESHGGGEPVVLIPSTGFSCDVWKPTQMPIAESCRMIIHDPRGCGRSTAPQKVYTINQMANDVVALFPQELVRDSSSGHLLSARDDVPWQAPALVELGYAAARGKAAARAAPHFRRPARWIAQAE